MVSNQGLGLLPAATDNTPASALPDVLADGLAVVFCGINPGLKAAATGHHFAGNGNRFWRALHLAGFTPTLLRAENDADLLAHGCGLTTAVARPTQRADQLSLQEFRDARSLLLQKIERHRPGWIAFLGKAAYAAISGQRQVQWGCQSVLFGGANVWVLPNPSGLNRAFSLDDLAAAYKALLLAMH
ncbi:G/U mismatch-specific DNA glycosylase [Andreprevotia sp. IGB-42]|uniref:G/U mismatch-specific DNA glycosylase n=1 Tax=Andreprevotia sp. IGB-42 TaxID=2497473 RepID=UPI001357DFBA|nr:G/U mismatch-specific DNA glycosylase [Andreprevotia sp. IGB-42]KAF0811349.1 G/U mismatch-specific DNA glycosylase [Andreprevotia sp. IGB-42]